MVENILAKNQHYVPKAKFRLEKNQNFLLQNLNYGQKPKFWLTKRWLVKILVKNKNWSKKNNEKLSHPSSTNAKFPSKVCF